MKTLGKNFKQAGISLLEVLLALAIIAIIYVMAMQYFMTATNNQKLNMVRTFIGADMAAIQGFGVNNNGFKTSGGTEVGWSDLVSGGYLSTDTKSLNCSSGDTGTTCQQVTPWGENVGLAVSGTVVTLSIPLPASQLCENLKQSYGVNTVSCATGETGGITATVYVNGSATT